MSYDVDMLKSETARISEENHEAMRSMESDIKELHAESRKVVGGSSRRDFMIRTGLAATAVTIGSSVIPMSQLWTPAFGQALTDGDIAAFAAGVEYAAVAAYTAAAGTGKVTGAALDAAKSFLKDHQAHGDAFFGASGGKATKTPNAKLVAALGPMITAAKDQTEILKIAYDTENAAAATYQFALGALTTVPAQKLAASILPIEAGHAATISMVLGTTLTDPTAVPPFQTETGAIKPG